MTDKKHRIGRGKIMSIAKAGLVLFYSPHPTQYGSSADEISFIYSGDLDVIHAIVDIAGAKHCSFLTHHQVLSCLRSSPLWTVQGTIPGWLERRAYCYIPSEKGKRYYDETLKPKLQKKEPL